jgi:hypothetical protein
MSTAKTKSKKQKRNLSKKTETGVKATKVITQEVEAKAEPEEVEVEVKVTKAVAQEVEVKEDLKEEAPSHTSPGMAKLIHDMANMMASNDKRGLLLLRRKVRYRIFRIRDSLMKGQTPPTEYDDGLRAWIDLQLRSGMTWFRLEKENGREKNVGGFSFNWDVSAKEPLKVIEAIEWDGGIDQDLFEKCGVKKCVPPAFTKQE